MIFDTVGILKWTGGCALTLMALFACLLITLWVLVIQFLPAWAQPINPTESLTATAVSGTQISLYWCCSMLVHDGPGGPCLGGSRPYYGGDGDYNDGVNNPVPSTLGLANLGI